MIRNRKSLCASAVVLALATAAAADPSPPAALSPQAAWYAAYLKESRLVSIPGSRALNLTCKGTGTPTVILEAGLGGDTYDWRAVFDDIAKQSRVCAYDRAG